MKSYENWEKTDAYTGDYEQLQLGGHICKILKVETEEKPYGELLRIFYDIAEGEQKDFYMRQYKRIKESNPDAKWQGMYYQTVKQDDLRFFKGFITAIEKSNTGYSWNWDEQKLIGKLFGGVIGQEEYLNKDNNVKVSTKCIQVRSVEQIRKGVDVPEIKRLSGSHSQSLGTLPIGNDDDLPF